MKIYSATLRTVNKEGMNPMEDDAKESVSLLLEHRLPWLVVGLIGGMLATLLSSRFEKVLSSNISLAYFIPVIVYMADAVGTQTENVYVRNLGKGRVRLGKYLAKEIALGICLGLLFGGVCGLFTFFWMGKMNTSITIALSLFTTIATAPLVALVVSALFNRTHDDPAVGAGPVTTVIQDVISITTYFVIATVILL